MGRIERCSAASLVGEKRLAWEASGDEPRPWTHEQTCCLTEQASSQGLWESWNGMKASVGYSWETLLKSAAA